MLNEFRLAGLRQPQVRETDGGTTHTGLQGIILCQYISKPSIQASTIQSDTAWATETSCNARRIETGGTISHR